MSDTKLWITDEDRILVDGSWMTKDALIARLHEGRQRLERRLGYWSWITFASLMANAGLGMYLISR
jgi:hypothetical protein